MKDIFVSYRRSDSSDVTGRIFDHLKIRFGEQRLFKDVDSIPLGRDFRSSISNAVAQCKVLLAVIGPDWLEASDEKGARRIDDPNDYVHIEIASALERNIPVIPVLVNKGEIPDENDLPDKLRPLSFRNGTPVRADPDFASDIKRVMDALEQYFSLPDVEAIEHSDAVEIIHAEVAEIEPSTLTPAPTVLPKRPKRNVSTSMYFWLAFSVLILIVAPCLSCSGFFLFGNSLLTSANELVIQAIQDDQEISEKLGLPITVEDLDIGGTDEDGRQIMSCTAKGSKENARVTGRLTLEGLKFKQGEFVITCDDGSKCDLPRK